MKIPSLYCSTILLTCGVVLLASGCKKTAPPPGTGTEVPPAPAPVAASTQKPQPTPYEQAEALMRKYRGMPSGDRTLSASEQKAWQSIAALSAEEIGRLFDQFDLPAESGDPFITDALRWLAAKKPVSVYCDCVLKAGNNPAAQQTTREVVASNPEAVKEWMKSAKFSGNDRTFQPLITLYGMLNALTGSDPRASLELAAKGSQDVRGVTQMIYQQWAFSDPEAAIHQAHANTSGPEQAFLESTIILCASQKDAPEAFRLANTGDYQVDPKSYARVFSAMLKDYSYEAIDSLPQTSSVRVQSILEQPEMIEKITAQKPEAMVQALSGVIFTQSNLPLFERAVTALNLSEPGMASELVASLPEGPAKEKLAAGIRH